MRNMTVFIMFIVVYVICNYDALLRNALHQYFVVGAYRKQVRTVDMIRT
jgi:hypothetical protein